MYKKKCISIIFFYEKPVRELQNSKLEEKPLWWNN